MIKIIAVLCSLAHPQDCHDHVLADTNFGNLSIPACMMGSPELKDMLIDLANDHPNERLSSWRCEMGDRAKHI